MDTRLSSHFKTTKKGLILGEDMTMGTRVWAAPATWFSTPQFQEIFLELQNEGKSQVEAFFFFQVVETPGRWAQHSRYTSMVDLRCHLMTFLGLGLEEVRSLLS